MELSRTINIALLRSEDRFPEARKFLVLVRVMRVDRSSAVKIGARTFLNRRDAEEYCADVFEMQDMISATVASALAIRLTDDQTDRFSKHYTDNPEAYQLYLKGVFLRNQMTPDSLKKSIESFQKAIDLDPHYALAYGGEAPSYDALTDLGAVPEKEGESKSKELGQRALQLREIDQDARVLTPEECDVYRSRMIEEPGTPLGVRCLVWPFIFILNAFEIDCVFTPEECDVYRSRTIGEPGPPLGVRSLVWPFIYYLERRVRSTAFSSAEFGHGHRTPKGVQNLGTLESYKHCTPPECGRFPIRQIVLIQSSLSANFGGALTWISRFNSGRESNMPESNKPEIEQKEGRFTPAFPTPMLAGQRAGVNRPSLLVRFLVAFFNSGHEEVAICCAQKNSN